MTHKALRPSSLLSTTCLVLALAQSVQAQVVNRTPDEKMFVTDTVIRDGYFWELFVDDGPPQIGGGGTGTEDVFPPEQGSTRIVIAEDPEPEADRQPDRIRTPESPEDRELRFEVQSRMDSAIRNMRRGLRESREAYLRDGAREANLRVAVEDLHRSVSNLERRAEEIDFSAENYADVLIDWFNDSRTVTSNAEYLARGILPPANVRNGLRFSERNAVASGRPMSGNLRISERNAPGTAADSPQFWAQATYRHVSNTAAAAREGSSVGIASGIVFQPSPDLSWGITLSYADGTNTSAPPLNTVLNSKTLGLSAHVTYTLPQEFNLTVLGRYSHGDHTISINGFTGAFGTDAISGSARISKSFSGPNGWVITPSIGTTFASLSRGTYVNSAGRTITGGTQTFGVLQPSIRFEKALVAGDTTFVPWLELNADWLYQGPAAATLSDGLVLAPSATGIGASGGVDIALGASTRAQFGGSYHVRGDDRFWSLNAGLRLAF